MGLVFKCLKFENFQNTCLTSEVCTPSSPCFLPWNSHVCRRQQEHSGGVATFPEVTLRWLPPKWDVKMLAVFYFFKAGGPVQEGRWAVRAPGSALPLTAL